MAQSIEDQITTIERALGERMVHHALVIVRSWLNELGENNPYEEAYEAIRSQYSTLFDEWLTSEDPHREEHMDQLTCDTYRLVDASYVSLRLQRGLSPEMHGFNPQNPQSVMRYFSNCLQFRDEDFEWVHEIMSDSDRAAIALLVVSSLSKNIRECFNERALLALIDGISSVNEVVAEQCIANLLTLFAHYDIRIDFFTDIQNAFIEAVEEMGDEGEEAFHTLCALVRSISPVWKEDVKSGELKIEDLPEELQNLLELTGEKNNIEGVVSWMPASEQEYMQGLVDILPDTWIFSALIGDSLERAGQMAIVYLSVGRMDLLWDNTDAAAKWLLNRLREGSKSPKDYINYAHCMLLQGDRMMAYEYYHQARLLCKGAKEFFALFRPDRRALVDHGIPVEHVYLIEDQLINN